jgi:hypothetical protein
MKLAAGVNIQQAGDNVEISKYFNSATFLPVVFF